MAAPSIPNLATLRGRGGGLRSRGRGRGSGSAEPQSDEDRARVRDQVIQQTDNDAASSRASAVSLGYLQDPYAEIFVPSPPPRRYPLINRGTYVRTFAIDRLVDRFLTTSPEGPKQIISLGAGSDTRYFRFSHFPNLLYHEIDFAVNTTTKISKIDTTPRLTATLKNRISTLDAHTTTPSKETLHSESLNIHALDLRSLASATPPPSPPNLGRNIPTLLLSECCLTYLPLPTANAILSHILTSWLDPSTPAAAVLYEPIKPQTPFGRTMTSNLASRRIDMPSLHALPTLQRHRDRLSALGMVDVGARTVLDIYAGSREGGGRDEAWIGPEERERVERAEWLDEVEEWQLLAGHYCVVWGWRDGDGDGEEGVFGRAWGGIKGQWREGERRDDELHAAGQRDVIG
ncbi:hypothetical protein CAC42_8027 [Sphaceloma murrayae]|uniref:Leucine carboxyl methyltransferase 1 n=1 Tax=Sphaceloma murrayae TaxID=2082308 RepID=A0A2K1QQW9_9PEZI|nr:hypothetical protein CAC42_8027 [Sphaceloma murrayae]